MGKDNRRGLWSRFLDALFPPRCVFCGRLTTREEPSCPRCRPYLLWLGEGEWDNARYQAFDGFCAPFYYEGRVQRAILGFKDTGRDWEADCFASLMVDALKRAYPEEAFTAAVPVPTTMEKLMKRGFNQTELLSRRVAEALGIPNLPHALLRLEETRTQHHLSALGRRLNAVSSYRSGEGKLEGSVLLIDDVATTGATLHACALALKEMGAQRVVALTLAATLKKTGNPVEKLDKNQYNDLL